MLTLYLLENSRAIRIEWALRELGLEHETRVYARVNGKRAPPEMAKESGFALGKSPALRDSDGDITVIESSAILLYLIARYGASSGVQLLPISTDWKSTAEVNAWMSFAEGALMVHALPITYASWFVDDVHAEVKTDLIRKLYPTVKSDLTYLDGELKNNLAKYGATNGAGAFLVGATLTAADVMMAFSAEYILTNPLFRLDGRWPHVNAWLRGLEARSAYKAALQVARYDYVL